MIVSYPSYYNDFVCIADRCRHSCCIGWEIDIDGDSLRRYEALEGPVGEYIRRGIDYTDTPHFRLVKDDHCYFLRQDGLCQMYRDLGEDSLCQICSDHPRFRSFFPERTEIGLGLCCEEAARLILSQTEPVRILRRGLPDQPESREVRAALRLRRQLIKLLQDRGEDISHRLENMLRFCGSAVTLPRKQWAPLFRSLERLDSAWDGMLDALEAPADRKGFARYMTQRQTEYEQLALYFLYRHLLSDEDFRDIPARAAFAALSVELLWEIGAALWTETGEFPFARQVELARMYSSEVEYSEENMTAVLSALRESLSESYSG